MKHELFELLRENLKIKIITITNWSGRDEHTIKVQLYLGEELISEDGDRIISDSCV